MQLVISLGFLYGFYRINRTVTVLQTELSNQNTTSNKLNQIADSIEYQIHLSDLKDSLDKDSMDKQKPAANKKPVSVKKKNNKVLTTPPIPIRVVSDEIRMYEYDYKNELALSKTESITEIKGALLIKYNGQKQLVDYKAYIEMKQANEEAIGTAQRLTFKCIGCEVKPDNSFRCIFQEIPLPAANELYAQNPRKLSVSIEGSFQNSIMNGLLTWNEIGGRPAYVRIKLPLKKVDNP
jgi:hypothetical protein